MVYVQYPNGKQYTFVQTSLGLLRISFDSELHNYFLECIKVFQQQ
jgi:hypothetical protein